MRLEGRVALVTGSGRNIGKAIALLFGQEGASVVLNGLSNKQALDEVAHEIQLAGGRAFPILADVSDPRAVNDLVSQASRELGPIDILISNASIRPHGRLTDLEPEQWRKIMAVDLDATFYLCRAVLPGMLEKGRGSLVAVSGSAAFGVRQNAIATATAKAGLIGMMRDVARTYARQGIRANTVVPGNMATARYDQDAYLKGQPAALLQSPVLVDERVPMGRKGLPEELATACLFLASDDAGYTTGQTLHVGGGVYMD